MSICSFLIFLFACFISCLFPKDRDREGKRAGMELGGWDSEEDLRRIGVGEIVIRIYCMKNVSFNLNNNRRAGKMLRKVTVLAVRPDD